MTPVREASWTVARDIAARMGGRLESEVVAVETLDGRVLAQDCAALCDLPSLDTSAMDGWAVAGPGPWRIVGEAMAGGPLAADVESGTCVRIATGAVVPRGTTAVLRWESATVAAGTVAGDERAGSNIRPAGEECRAGDVVARAGLRASPALAGLLAATGHDQVAVVRRPRVRLLLLGDELLSSGIPAGGQVRDSLGPQLPGWLRRCGAEVVGRQRVPDALMEAGAAFADATADADLLITTGGTARGPRDHVHGAIGALDGSLLVDRVAVRPGHPMLLATLPGPSGPVPLVGLPGNPHSAVVGLVTLALPLVESMLGLPFLPLSRVVAADDLRAPAGHVRLIAGRIVDGRFVLAGHGGSAMLRGLAGSTGFAVVTDAGVPAGAEVDWLPLP